VSSASGGLKRPVNPAIDVKCAVIRAPAAKHRYVVTGEIEKRRNRLSNEVLKSLAAVWLKT